MDFLNTFMEESISHHQDLEGRYHDSISLCTLTPYVITCRHISLIVIQSSGQLNSARNKVRASSPTTLKALSRMAILREKRDKETKNAVFHPQPSSPSGLLSSAYLAVDNEEIIRVEQEMMLRNNAEQTALLLPELSKVLLSVKENLYLMCIST